MKQITVLEISDYEKLTPGMLVIYLEKHGWERIWGNTYYEFWKLDAYPCGALVPIYRFDNFADKICNAIKAISETYCKDEVDVFNEILELGKEEFAKLVREHRRKFIRWLVDNQRVFEKFEITLQKETVKFRYPDSNNRYLTDYFNAIDFADGKIIYEQPFKN